jgi:predicted metal-dependent hydrolase
MSAFEKKTLDNGNPNPKYIDLCDEDQPIAGQKFACMSFVSPEKILKKRETYLFDEFVKQWEFAKSMEKFGEFLQFMSYKYSLQPDDVMKNFDEFKTEEQAKLRESSVIDDYRNFLDKCEDKLNEQFNREHAFQTSVRGLKVRGVFPTQEEAEMKCKKLREMDPHHDIFVGPVGMWIPWDPDAYKTGRMEYMEEQLNALHKAKLENEEKAKQEFDRRVKETKKKAIEENIKLATKSGNVLTQTMDKEGNLVGVTQNVNFEEREVADEESTRLYNEALVAKAREEESIVDNLPVD